MVLDYDSAYIRLWIPPHPSPRKKKKKRESKNLSRQDCALQFLSGCLPSLCAEELHSGFYHLNFVYLCVLRCLGRAVRSLV